MAEFQWWLLIVGLVAGGGLVAVVQMDGRRREEDLAPLERRAEATWIADRLARRDPELDLRTVEAVLRLHRDYLSLPPPDRLLIETEDGELVDAERPPSARDEDQDEAAQDEDLDGDADGDADEVGDDGSGGADGDLAGAGEEETAAGEEAHAGADPKERPDR